MTIERDEPLYVISVAARMIGVHAQTLRYYERNGLVEPQRSRGNVRYYSDTDVARIQKIKSLIDELGVNLAGAEVIMRMTQQMAEMETHIRDLESRLNKITGRASLPETAGGDGFVDNQNNEPDKEGTP